MKEIFFIFFFPVFIFFIAFAIPSLQITLSLNASEAEWNETINASGYVNYPNGTPWSGKVKVEINGSEACTTNASLGFYSCVFKAPLEINKFSVFAYALDDATILGKSNEEILSVIYFYGSKKVTKNVASLEFPSIIQDLNGKISIVKVNLMVWG